MPEHADPAGGWWSRRRLRYNFCLIGSIVVGFVAYLLILDAFKTTIGRPYVHPDGTATGVYDIDVDDAPFGGCAAVCGIGVVVLLANLCYFLGPALERLIPATFVPRYRPVAWWAGTVLSCTPPLAIPALHLVLCLFFPNTYDRSPIPWPFPTSQPATVPTSAPTTQGGNGNAS